MPSKIAEANAKDELAAIRRSFKDKSAKSSVNVTGEGSDRFAADAVDAIVYRASEKPSMQLSAGAARMAGHPLWAIAAQCLEHNGIDSVNLYSPPESISEAAMNMGNPSARTIMHSSSEDFRYVQASADSPASRPGDFPNILANVANKFIDTIELDDEYSFESISAMTPTPLKDFKPALMANLGVVDELDELQDAEQLKDLTLEEEALSYIFLRRFGNKFGWTPVMIADDDMNAFAEGMIGLSEAWQVTQNRLVLDRLTSNETLLDGYPLFANRPDTGSAANNNTKVGASNKPTDEQWGAMDDVYSEIGGIGTSKRVRGELNTCLTPTGSYNQEARRTFFPLNSNGVEAKTADTTENVGIYRGNVAVVSESELKGVSPTTWYGFRSPTKSRTATIVRAYFSGFGKQGRRETWRDPSNKTLYVSLEGRIGVAVKNWRYAIRNSVA